MTGRNTAVREEVSMDQPEAPAGEPRHIVLFSDGTGNSSASLFKTNIRRLYEALDVTDPHPLKHPRQFAFYDDGVGTSGFRPLALLGGAFGWGLARNVRDLYAFLCRIYRPGDLIYAFGFSRGAFTVRVVAGLVMHQGIVRYDGDEAALGRKVSAAYRAYRGARYGGRILATLARPLRDALLAIRDKVMGYAPYRRVDNVGSPEAPAEQQVTIRFIGCFDTVDAYGLPVEELTRAFDAIVFPITMPDAKLNPRVRRACQALCLDDRRRTFKPRLWSEQDEKPEPGNPERGPDGDRITQVWFAGMHSDVGGGYPDDALARVPMQWMAWQARRAGLRFSPDVLAQQLALMDESGPMHDSRRGLAGYYRYQPREPVALALEAQQGQGTPRIKLHDAVLRRIKVGQDGYVPINLPAAFDVIVPSPAPVPRGAPPPQDGLQDSATLLALGQQAQQGLKLSQALAWDWVWWRRLAYFWTLCATLALGALPALLTTGSCSSWACFLLPLLRLVGAVLPGFAAPWIDVFAANPATTLLLLIMIGAGILAGSFCEDRAGTAIRSRWYRDVPNYAPSLPKGKPNLLQPGQVNLIVRALRTHRIFAVTTERVRRFAVPVMVALIALWVGIGFGTSAIYSAATALGMSCRAGGAPAVHLDFRQSSSSFLFDTQQRCAFSGVVLEKGGRYRIWLVIPSLPGGGAPWSDASLHATPNGLQDGRSWLTMFAFTPYRRHLSQPWFKLILRVGQRGATVLAPDWRWLGEATEGPEHQIYEAEVTSDRDGGAFFYVNDGVSPLGRPDFYRNNSGVAKIIISLHSLH
jgi:uncharacterized protein (DUF2235 family)